MKLTKLAITGVAALAGLAVVAPGVAQAEYPEKPVSFVVPFPPGDVEDVLTRLIAAEVSGQDRRFGCRRQQARRWRRAIPRRS